MASNQMKLYDINDNKREDVEYHRTVEEGRAPDSFPCGHVLCHHCLREHVKPKMTKLQCPVCSSITELQKPVDGATLACADSEIPNITLMSNFDDIVKKFNGINYTLRRLKEENVQSRSMAMTYTNNHCDLCHEHHGTLNVVQEYNQLTVSHERPINWHPYFYRLMQGHVVTTFYSKVNTASICVPCSYKELRDSQRFKELEYMPDREAICRPETCLAEVGKIIASDITPVMCLQGKNVIEVDHKIRVRERADRFDFFDTTDQIEHMVKQQEKSLIRMANKQIEDTGRLYHIQDSSEVEYNKDETSL
ncbi:uncharacterized protein LOC126809616 [Patella vulgata]|uniref:uncharacterized protein LOC126809616 n=1 Tax=Patella vulgata TaxID=6465 RepID=UPI00217F7353|nr:uncharacterized protein LOC126809616 [Patella vulgata]XP_050390238.1 uncharacterized protein LOC126809616 [Patella vulgata]XP_050390239.1 uncharacterized protein LOC126809616 [Patella vulgata]XP_050390240.1 uncharacterized protein LOC126809616 [Patella vulgata]